MRFSGSGLGIKCLYVLHFKSSPYFYSKKYLKHFITKLIEVELKVKAKLKVAHNYSTHSEAQAAWGSRGWNVLCCTHRDYWSPEGVWRDIFELPAKAGSQGLAWAPCPGQPHSGPHSPELPAEDLPMFEVQDGPLPGAPGCCGPQSGRNHNGYFQFRLHFEFYLN